MGIYLMTLASGIVVRGNVLREFRMPDLLVGAGINVVEKQFFYFSSPAVHLDARAS